MKRLVALSLAAIFSLVPAASANAYSPADAMRPVGVRILAGSKINLVSHESKMPVAIINEFDTEVRVMIHVRPRTLQVVLPEVTELVIPAQTTLTAKIPISASSDGEVILDAWLTTFSGLKFGKPVELSINVNEDVELYFVLGFAGVVGLLIFIGVTRTLRKRSRGQLVSE